MVKEKMAEYGIQANRAKSGRVTVSRPDGHGPYRTLSNRWFDVALEHADLVVGDIGKCDVARCVRDADIVTQSGAVICPKHPSL